MLQILILLLIVSFGSIKTFEYDEDLDCKFPPINYHLRSPLIMSPVFKGHNNDGTTFNYINHDESMILFCPNRNNYFFENDPTTKVMALTCFDGKLENLESPRMQCNKPIRLELHFIAKSCWNNSEETLWFQLGLDLPEDKHYTLIEGCYHRSEERTLFTIHRLDGLHLNSIKIYTDEMSTKLNASRLSLSKYFAWFQNQLKSPDSQIATTTSRLNLYKKKPPPKPVENPKPIVARLAKNYDELFNFELFEYCKNRAFYGGPTMNITETLMEEFMDIYDSKNTTIDSLSLQPLKSCQLQKFTFRVKNSECEAGQGFSAFFQIVAKEGSRSIMRKVKTALNDASIKLINNILSLAFPQTYEKFVHHTLSPYQDFVLPLQKYGAIHYMNNVPIGNSLLDSQWTALEEKIRTAAILMKAKFTIVTGVLDILPISDGGEFLGFRNKIPVPKYIWKIVIDSRTNYGVVFVLYNSEKGGKEDLCENVCKTTTESNIICCSVSDFMGKIPNAPQIEVDGYLVIKEK